MQRWRFLARISMWAAPTLALVSLFAACAGDEPHASVTASATATAMTSAIPTTEPTALPGFTCAPPYPQPPYTAASVGCADPSPMQPARVLRIVDGDTLHVEVDGIDETLRIFGIDTAERGDVCFREASERLAALAGSEIRIVPDRRNRDRNGRLLRYVYSTSGVSIDARLIAEGLAHAWTSDGALRDPLVALEADARAAKRGCLWR